MRPEAGLTLAGAQLLSAAGWSPERLEMLHGWASTVGATFCSYRLSARTAVMDLGGVRWFVHRELTQEKALRYWTNLPAGTLVEAWTDGSGTSTDEAVGSAAAMLVRGELLDSAVSFAHSTYARDGKVSSQVAELYGLALAVANCPRSDLRLELVADSQYGLGVVDLAKGWNPKQNAELVWEIRHMLELRPATFRHVNGHVGLPLNEMADKIAGRARKKGK